MNKTNKPLQIAPFANNAYKEAQERRKEEREMREVWKELLGVALVCVIAFVLINAMYML